MTLSLQESQALNDMAETLYSFLPGSPHPYAAPEISFPGVAQKFGLSKYWIGGSKRPALTQLLQTTLEKKRNLFSNLILEIVRTGMIYRNNKKDPIKLEEIQKLNDQLRRISLKIPELWDPAFIDSLPRLYQKEKAQIKQTNQDIFHKLKEDLVKLTSLAPQPRGFAFEKFLNELFLAYNLNPRGPFRLIGEQIDGSFQIGSDTYLVEAKWQEAPVGEAELLSFDSRVVYKSKWSRGLYISYNGFSSDGLIAFSKHSTCSIGMNCRDLYFILEGEMSLIEAINRKARHTAETGEFFIEVYELSKNG
jgi:hypothetical protein